MVHLPSCLASLLMLIDPGPSHGSAQLMMLPTGASLSTGPALEPWRYKRKAAIQLRTRFKSKEKRPLAHCVILEAPASHLAFTRERGTTACDLHAATGDRASAMAQLLGCGFWSYSAHMRSTLSRLSRAFSRLALTLSCDGAHARVVRLQYETTGSGSGLRWRAAGTFFCALKHALNACFGSLHAPSSFCM